MTEFLSGQSLPIHHIPGGNLIELLDLIGLPLLVLAQLPGQDDCDAGGHPQSGA